MKFFLVKTVLLLPVICVGVLAQTPQEIVHHFVQMDVGGARLSPGGWHEADKLFTRSSSPPRDIRIVVIADHYNVSEMGSDPGISYAVGYEEIGTIDSALNFRLSKSRAEVRRFDRYAVRKQGSAWKIEGGQPSDIHLTPRTAIRYLAQRKNASTDANIRANATKSIAALKRYD